MNSDWTKLFEGLADRFYIELIMWIIEFTAIIIGLKFVRKQRVGLLFILYISFDFTILNVDLYLEYFSSLHINSTKKFTSISNALISFMELVVYYCFFKKVIHSNHNRKTMKIFSILASIIAVLIFSMFFIDKTNFRYTSVRVSVVVFIFLLVPSAMYFLQLMTTNSKLDLFNRPSFWIVTGVFLYAIISIPYYLMQGLIFETNNKYRMIISTILFFVPFTSNFVFLIKAFLCKKELTI